MQSHGAEILIHLIIPLQPLLDELPEWMKRKLATLMLFDPNQTQ
jgi:hypothetical protein